MKKILMAVAAMMLVSACQPASHGCDDCEKMAREAKAKHEASKDTAKKGCQCGHCGKK